jgi:lipoate-protein ligase A
MKYLDATLDSPEANLACDEALLDACDAGELGAVLRVWEPAVRFVVVGYANRVASETNVEACRALGVPILRRCSGGGTVLQGPGCLNYALVFPLEPAGPLSGIAATNRWIMERHRDTLAQVAGIPVQVQGHTDLAAGGRKVSGNAQRRKRRAVLFHGCFLLAADLCWIERCLAFPSQTPDYRAGRAHADFVANLSLPPDALKAALMRAWDADAPLDRVPSERIEGLVRARYGLASWNLRG